MLQKISNSQIDRGFITVFYPGAAVAGSTDTGLGSIGRIDHAYVADDLTIEMHPHANDEILSYFRTGKCDHKDSEGYAETIGGRRLMLMKAGRLFHHEELIRGRSEPMEGLQIFIRPGEKDLRPEVVFHDLEALHSDNQWRLLASPTDETTFRFSSQTWIYDMKLLKSRNHSLLHLPKGNLTGLLYVFRGAVSANGRFELMKKDCLLVRDEAVSLTANEDAELVLFMTDENAHSFSAGMFSGNQKRTTALPTSNSANDRNAS